jgi:hypothetical protein
MWRDPKSLSIKRIFKNRTRRSSCEPLEQRIALSISAPDSPAMEALASAAIEEPAISPQHASTPMFPGGLLVTATEIITDTEVIPRFVANPTITNVRSGDWTDPSIWSLGRVPTDSDRVAVGANTTVTYSALSNARIDGLEINGSLVFSSVVNTRLLVANLTVMPSGTLQIGTAANPLPRQLKAEIVIADKPLDLVLDPRQYGTGMIVLGKIDIHGAQLVDTWSRLDAEGLAGQTSLVVKGDVTDWRAGDTLVLPDTRQVPTSEADAFLAGTIPPEWEEATIDHVVGNRIFLKAALQFDHLGARNSSGQIELLPHVAILNRNVVIRSENPNGVRGHTIYVARANVDIEYARFQDLGRTDGLQELDSTTFDANGDVTHVGTNQIGRYAVHFHHLVGPENPTNTGYQFKFVGNTVDGSKKWGVAIHDSSWGLIDENVVYNAQGAGIVTEDGTEIGNSITHNITIRMQGTYEDGKYGTLEGDYGAGGSGFWFRAGGNNVVGNVAADSTYAGFVIDGYYLQSFTLPSFRGAVKNIPGQGYTTNQVPSGFLGNNEAYGMTAHGLWAAFVLGDNLVDSPQSTRIYNLRLWNIHHAAVVAYHTAGLTFDRLLVLGDQAANDRNDTGPYGMDLKTYENRNLVIRNSRIENMYFGIYAPRNDSSQPGIERPTIIQNSTLKNYINIVVSPSNGSRPSNGNSLVVRDVKFALLTKVPDGPSPAASILPAANIYMQFTADGTDYTQPSVVRVYNYNQVAGDDFQVFYREQASWYVMPQTDASMLSGRGDGVVGSPSPGLNNYVNWITYGIATAGGLLPAGAAASRPEINGLVAAIQNPALLAPRVVLVTPWQGTEVTGNAPLRIRYNVIGALPAGATVYFSLDGGPAFSKFLDGGIFNVGAGQHTLRVYIGDTLGRQWPGTTIVNRTFNIKLPGISPAATIDGAVSTTV